MKEYNLDFYQAIKIVMECGAIKGHQFIDGIFLKLNCWGQFVIVDAARLYLESSEVFILNMKNQKFRELTVMTMKELCS